jgi:hypothetical protein
MTRFAPASAGLLAALAIGLAGCNSGSNSHPDATQPAPSTSTSTSTSSSKSAPTKPVPSGIRPIAPEEACNVVSDDAVAAAVGRKVNPGRGEGGANASVCRWSFLDQDDHNVTLTIGRTSTEGEALINEARSKGQPVVGLPVPAYGRTIDNKSAGGGAQLIVDVSAWYLDFEIDDPNAKPTALVPLAKAALAY